MPILFYMRRRPSILRGHLERLSNFFLVAEAARFSNLLHLRSEWINMYLLALFVMFRAT